MSSAAAGIQPRMLHMHMHTFPCDLSPLARLRTKAWLQTPSLAKLISMNHVNRASYYKKIKQLERM